MAENTSKLITKISGIIVLLGAFIFFMACFLNIVSLVQLSPSYTPIKINTSLSFIFTGIGLIACGAHYRKIAFFCGSIIGIISLITLIEYGFNINLGIDQLFINFNKEAPYLGRMHPLTACGLLFISFILLLSRRIKTYTYYFLVRLFSAVVFIIGVVALGGYMAHVEIAYSLGSFSAMSPQAAALFILAGIGFCDYAWEGELLKDKNMLAICCSIAVPILVLLSSVVFWRQSIQQEYIDAVDDLKQTARLVKRHITYQINQSVLDLQYMARRWEASGGTPEHEWRTDAENYIRVGNALIMIEWIHPSAKLIWLEPQVDSARLLSQLIAHQPKITNNDAAVFLSSSFPLSHDQRVLFAFVPIKQQGFIVGAYDTARLVDRELLPESHTLYDIQIKDGADLIYSSNATNGVSRNAISLDLSIFNKHWTLIIDPKKEFFDKNSSLLPYLELISGILFTLLIGSTLYYTLTSLRRNKLLIEKTEALEHSERRQQQLVDGILDHAIIWLDLKGDVETWNSGAERIYGYSAEEIINSNFSIFFMEEDKSNDLPLKFLSKAIDNGAFAGEAEQVCKSKSTFWASVNIDIIKNAAAERIGFAMIVRDISQRKLFENERSKLISIIEESPDFIGMADMSGSVLYHNRGAKQMVGLTDDVDLNLLKIANMHPVWAFNVVYNQGIPTVLKEGSWSGETALLHQVTGEEIPVLQTIFLHKDPHGNPICLNTIMRDITERKKWEEDLKNSEETLRVSMEHAAIGIAFVSPKGKWLKVNKALCNMIGYTENELFKLDFQAITHPDDLEKDLNFVGQMLEGTIKTYQMEKRYFHKNGQIIWVQLNVTLSWKANGKPNYFISQIQNITGRKAAEEAQERLISQLVQSNMELERFVYAASHDLQEPLRMIVCFSDILMKEHDKQLNNDGIEYLSIITESGKRMQQMIQDLLEYSRVTKSAQSFQAVECSAALEHALENMKLLIEEEQAKVTFDPLPRVNGNFTQIAQVLQHLMSNAIKYKTKEFAPLIHVGAEDDDTFWRIFVKDNGIGIPVESKELIFQPFRRLHSWSSINGTGIGLALCKTIIENHGGKIWVESVPDNGSIFYFTLKKA